MEPPRQGFRTNRPSVLLWWVALCCAWLLPSCVTTSPGAHWTQKGLATVGAAVHLTYDPEGLVLPVLSVSGQAGWNDEFRAGLTFSGLPFVANYLTPFVAYSPRSVSGNRIVLYSEFPFYFGLENEGSFQYVFFPTITLGASFLHQYEPSKSLSGGIKFDPRFASNDLDSTAVDFLDVRKYGINLALADHTGAGVAVNQVQWAFPSRFQYSFEFQALLPGDGNR